MFASILTAHALALQVLVPPAATQDCRLDQMTNTAIDQKALARFGSAVQEYARLHRRLERVTMPLEAMPDEEGASLAADALADAIRAARPDARQGAVFDQDVSELIRFRIERTLWLHAYTTAETLGD